MLVVALAAGFATAGAVDGLEHLLHAVVTGPTAGLLLLPAAGLVVNALVRHHIGGRTGPDSIDEYINAVHDRAVDPRANAARAVGSVATVGLGAALDPSGLGALIGTTMGDAARRWWRTTGPELLVVGVAAGFGAALHAPVSGAVMAIEVPYREGADWRRFPTALIGSVIGFVARGLVEKFTLPFRTDIGVVGVRDVLLAIGLAVLAGFASRVVAWSANRAQRGLGPTFAREWHHVATGAAALIALCAISRAGFDHVPVSVGPGQIALGWAATASVAGLCALVAVRVLATSASVLGRGTGGLVLPLLVMGWIAGCAVAKHFDGNLGLLAVIGAATLLGAGYRVPFAAIVWLAESTHSVPAILLGSVAVLVASSVGGGRSVSTAQRQAPRSGAA